MIHKSIYMRNFITIRRGVLCIERIESRVTAIAYFVELATITHIYVTRGLVLHRDNTHDPILIKIHTYILSYIHFHMPIFQVDWIIRNKIFFRLKKSCGLFLAK